MAEEEEVGGGVHRPPIRIGIAGLGRAALFDHLPTLKKIPHLFQLVGVCDLLKERRDIVEQEFPDVHTYRQIEDMLDDPEIDLVDITLPSLEHSKTALSSLNRGKWTLVEAPLALSHEDATVLKAASVKARNKLVAYTPGLFSPDFRLAQMALDDPRLGEPYELFVSHQDFVRRDDWQSVKRCGGGIAWTEAQDALLEAMALLRVKPAKLWSELKRVASVGDAEDFLRVVLKSSGAISVAVEVNGGSLPPHGPSFRIHGERGAFSVMPGCASGTLHVIDPAFKFSRRRSSVRTPPLADLHEQIPVVDIPFVLPANSELDRTAFWRALYATIRTAVPFPVSLDDVLEAIRYIQIAKSSSPFAK